MRRHANLNLIPFYCVDAVVEVPFGCPDYQVYCRLVGLERLEALVRLEREFNRSCTTSFPVGAALKNFWRQWRRS